MKRLLTILALAIALVGCEKNNDLVGTKWMTTGYSSFMKILYGGTWNRWFEFTTNDEVYCYWTDASGNVIDSDGDFYYEYDYPTLVIHASPDVETYTFNDRHSFTYVKPDGTLNKSMTYHKQ